MRGDCSTRHGDGVVTPGGGSVGRICTANTVTVAMVTVVAVHPRRCHQTLLPHPCVEIVAAGARWISRSSADLLNILPVPRCWSFPLRNLNDVVGLRNAVRQSAPRDGVICSHCVALDVDGTIGESRCTVMHHHLRWPARPRRLHRRTAFVTDRIRQPPVAPSAVLQVLERGTPVGGHDRPPVPVSDVRPVRVHPSTSAQPDGRDHLDLEIRQDTPRACDEHRVALAVGIEVLARLGALDRGPPLL